MGTEDDCFRRQKFEHIMSLLESSYPSLGLHKKEIEGWFSKLTHSPDHPPYASMIERAITELNEQGGSTEEMIAKFIEAEYEDLPTAHTSLLTHHLQKLVKKGDIVCTSGNYYILSIENSDFHKLKKGLKRMKMRCGKGRQNGRQHKVKGAQSKKEQKLEDGQEQNQVNAKIFEGVKEQKQAEDKQIGPTGEQKQQGHVELIEEHSKVEGLQCKLIKKQAEAKQDEEGNEEYDQMQELLNQQEKDLDFQQFQVLGETSELLVEENNHAEDTKHGENHGVTESEHQKEQKNDVIEEQKSEKLEKKNQVQDQESEAREKQVQLPEVRTEAMVEQINLQGEKIEVSEEEKGLREQQMEVCCQIIDLRNMLLRFIKKEKKDEATLSSQNYVTSRSMDLSGLSHLKKEEYLQLLEETNKVEGKLIHIIASLNIEASDNNKSKPEMGEQQLEVCDQLKVSEYRPITTPASESVPTHAMQLEQNAQIEVPTHKRLPEVEITSLEELCEKQYKQIKLSDQQQAPKCQTKSKTISLDVPCDALCGETKMVSKRIKSVPEDNYPTTEPHSKYSGEASTSMPETKNSYLVGFIEQLQISRLCGQEKLPESQLVSSSLNVLLERSLEHQQQTTSNNEAKEPEYKQQPENPIEGSHIEYELTAVEHQFQSQQQMSEQQQHILLQSLSEKPCKAQLAADTSVGKQFDQSKQTQKQHQQRQLRPRGPRPSESKQVLTTVEDVHDVTLAFLKSEMNKKPKPSITKRPREPTPKTLIELSKPTEQQMKHHGQKKRFKYRPTITAVDSAITYVQLQRRQLRPRGQGPSQSDLVVQKTREESLPLQLQPKRRGRGRPPKPKTNAELHWC